MSIRHDAWTNYETWCVNLWIENEEERSGFWQDQAKELLKLANRNDAIHALANRLEDTVSNHAPELGSSIYADLLKSALEEVNWHEIANHIITNVEFDCIDNREE